jgi:hypothetical protein
MGFILDIGCLDRRLWRKDHEGVNALEVSSAWAINGGARLIDVSNSDMNEKLAKP